MCKKLYTIVILSILFVNTIHSQIIYSPYSLFGVGQIEDNGFGSAKAMGGTGIAFQSKNSLNNTNPASYSGIDNLNFLFEFGFSLYNTNYATAKGSVNRHDGNIQYLAIGLRLSKIWSMSIGLSPISKVGYIINSTDQINGEAVIFDKTYTGKGGINKFYVGNSFKINKNLSLGINASGIFGTITQTETAYESSGYSGYSVENIKSMNGFYLDYGMQYSFKIKDYNYVIGIIYGGKKGLNTTSDIKINYQEDIVEVTEENVDKFELPQKLGVGISVGKKNKWRGGIDYEKKNWGEIEFSNSFLTTRNSERFSMGVEFFPRTRSEKNVLKNLYYRLGANYNKSYLKIDNIPINSYAITAGLGIPIRRQLNMINISFEYGQNGTTKDELMRERYWRINLSLSMRDIWFQKNRYF